VARAGPLITREPRCSSLRFSSRRLSLVQHLDIKGVLVPWEQLAAITMPSFFKRLAGRKKPEIVAPNTLISTLHETAAGAAQPHSLTVPAVPTPTIHSAADSGTANRSERATNTNYNPVSQEDLFPNNQVHGLRVLYQPSNPLVDIIFVHGLTGDSYNTWLQPTSGIYWPVQLLSKDISDARIMTFGYDADVTKFLGPVGQNNLRDHASNLLAELAARRAEDNSVSSSLC
jgi:hypothetical protein